MFMITRYPIIRALYLICVYIDMLCCYPVDKFNLIINDVTARSLPYLNSMTIWHNITYNSDIMYGFTNSFTPWKKYVRVRN